VVPGGAGPASPIASPTTGAKSAKAVMVVKIPPPAQQHTRKRPFYISPNTKSFGIFVAPVGSTQTPSPSNAQIFPVATPSPCAATPSGGDVCTFDVQAPYGNDIFYIAAFSVASPGPNSTPLSTFVSGAVTVAAGVSPSPLPFTLNAVAASVAVVVASPDPGNTPNTQVFPIGAATTAPLAVTAYDSTGSAILLDPSTPFDSPVSLTLTPASDGLTLSLSGASSCGSTASGSTASLGCAEDFNALSLAYDGSTHADSTDHAIDAFTIAASPQASPVPSPASIVLSSNVLYYPITSNFNLSSGQLVPISNTQLLYVVSNGAAYVGTFNTTTHTGTTPTAVTGLGNPQSLAVSPNGTVWAVDYQLSPPVVDCWTSLANFEAGQAPALANYSPVYGTDPMEPFAVAVDKANGVWIQAQDTASQIDYLLEFTQAGTTCSPVASFGPSNSVNLGSLSEQEPVPMTALPNANGVAFNSTDSGVLVATTANLGGSVAPINPVTPGTNATTGGIAADPAGNVFSIYAITGTEYDLEELTSGGNANSRLTYLPPSATVLSTSPQPAQLTVFSPTGASADRALFIDQDFDAAGVVGGLPASPLSELIGLSNISYPLATAHGPNGEAYVLVHTNSATQQIAVERVINTNTWAVPPTTWNQSLSCSNEFLFSINERGDTGTFTVTSTPNGTLTPFPGTTPHDFLLTVTGASPQTVTVTITDPNGRSQSVPFFVNYNNGC
jgi:hypothetical protein